ncbi:hypothetical protein IIB50_02655 [Patescibacteria group bacterium]|nr:hypothetical protein [Patescibacteria group bacterium]
MKNMIKKMFLWGHQAKDDIKSNHISTTQIKRKKEKAIQHVGERYGRAISRLSDT